MPLNWYLMRNITLDPKGGEVNPTSLRVRAGRGSVYGALPTPEREGYTFNTWQRKLTAQTIQINNGYVRIKDNLVKDDVAFIRNTTFSVSLDAHILSDKFREYLARRNEVLDLTHSQRLAL